MKRWLRRGWEALQEKDEYGHPLPGLTEAHGWLLGIIFLAAMWALGSLTAWLMK